MRFPSISDIASTTVIYIDSSASISDAIEMMLENNHRNIIIKDVDIYRILTVVDILNMQSKSIDLTASLKDLNLITK